MANLKNQKKIVVIIAGILNVVILIGVITTLSCKKDESQATDIKKIEEEFEREIEKEFDREAENDKKKLEEMTDFSGMNFKPVEDGIF